MQLAQFQFVEFLSASKKCTFALHLCLLKLHTRYSYKYNINYASCIFIAQINKYLAVATHTESIYLHAHRTSEQTNLRRFNYDVKLPERGPNWLAMLAAHLIRSFAPNANANIKLKHVHCNFKSILTVIMPQICNQLRSACNAIRSSSVRTPPFHIRTPQSGRRRWRMNSSTYAC